MLYLHRTCSGYEPCKPVTTLRNSPDVHSALKTQLVPEACNSDSACLRPIFRSISDISC